MVPDQVSAQCRKSIDSPAHDIYYIYIYMCVCLKIATPNSNGFQISCTYQYHLMDTIQINIPIPSNTIIIFPFQWPSYFQPPRGLPRCPGPPAAALLGERPLCPGAALARHRARRSRSAAPLLEPPAAPRMGRMLPPNMGDRGVII